MKTIRFTFLAAALAAALVLPAAAQDAQHLTVIHTFPGGTGTGDPGSQLVEDSAGNFYGATFWAGNSKPCVNNKIGCGVIYRLTPQGDHWVYTELYEFFSDKEGAEASQLILDAAGNLYGVFSAGGTYYAGSVFELSPTSSGPWKFTNLYTFTGGTDGNLPDGALAFDNAGNLYGTTAYGGSVSEGLGTVFELSRNGSGGWNETVLYSFDFPYNHPNAPLVFDAAGNLYGSSAGGEGTLGGVFELKHGWTFVPLYAFTGGSDGYVPEAHVTLDAAGNIYGTTIEGGSAHGDGTIYELSPSSGGGYTFNVLYTFEGGNSGGPSYNPVTFDSSGNLFGSANEGAYGWGVVFELSPSASGWSYGLVHTFTGGADGGYPGGLILDGGNLYGTAVYGAKPGCINNSGCGTVFKLSSTPSGRD